MRVIELTKKKKNTKPRAEVEEMIKKMRKEDEKPVKGVFEFTEAEGGFFEFAYRVYPGDPITTYQLVHGEVCEIPMGLVKHLNNTKKKIVRYANVEQANTGSIRTPRETHTISRVRFTPTEYV